MIKIVFLKNPYCAHLNLLKPLGVCGSGSTKGRIITGPSLMMCGNVFLNLHTTRWKILANFHFCDKFWRFHENWPNIFKNIEKMTTAGFLVRVGWIWSILTISPIFHSLKFMISEFFLPLQQSPLFPYLFHHLSILVTIFKSNFFLMLCLAMLFLLSINI